MAQRNEMPANRRRGYMFHQETDSAAAKRFLDEIATTTRELTERGEAAAALGPEVTQVLHRIAAGQHVPEVTLDRALAAAGKLKRTLVFQVLKRFPRVSA
jgi:hypothetical protein